MEWSKHIQLLVGGNILEIGYLDKQPLDASITVMKLL